MRHPRTAFSAALTVGLTLAAALGAVPATAAVPADSPTKAAVPSYVAYEGSAADTKATRAFFQAVLKSVAEQRAANPGARVVTVTYNATSAPTFRSQIARSTQIWNSSVTNVRLQEGSNPNFRYYEGNDARGSYASTDGRGRGYIFLDYRQNQQYDSYRVTSHETGHVLGLPDNYRGPCSELMSGGGPGPSCRNAVPNTQERSRVNSIWAYGLAAAAARIS
ncbi:snapalysin [Streptomyces sp. NBC_00690]|uniref:snapalysin n=1 Tax=Streptomyces sp. NBC_00690 TaxID=2975808 RepID=UPI002E284BCA|nr:snapalysin [Streptomyces sp. NBC_00690]